jgi:hypothetical protein
MFTNPLRRRLNDKIDDYDSRLYYHNMMLDTLDYYGDSEELRTFKNEVKSRKDYLDSLKQIARNIDVSDIPSNIEALDELIQDKSLANDIESYRRNVMLVSQDRPVRTTATVNPTYNADGTISGTGRNPYFILSEKGHEGKFTSQFKSRKPHLRHLKSLEQFSHYILAHPSEFNKISHQRANYYKNLIERKGGMKSIRETLQPTKEREKYGNKIDKVCSVLDTKRGLFNSDKGMDIGGYYAQAARMRGQSAITHETPFEDLKDWVNGMEKDILYSDINSLSPTQIEEKITNYVRDNPSIHISEYNSPFTGKGRLSKKMIKDLRAYHKQVGGKISAKDFELMLKETYKSPDKRDKHIGDYYIDESLSTPENVVYHNPKTNETKVAYRGTEGTLKDWGNNALYTFGMHNTSKRYKRANETQKKVEQKYGTANLDVLGHSQSGAFSQEIGKNAKNVVVLNPASHPLYTSKTKNTTVVRSKGDSVSALKYLNPFNWGKKADVEIEAKTYNPITEHMPSVLERLPEDTILGNGRKRKRNKKLRNLCNCGMCAYCR